MIPLRAAQRFCRRAFGGACSFFYSLIHHAPELICPGFSGLGSSPALRVDAPLFVMLHHHHRCFLIVLPVSRHDDWGAGSSHDLPTGAAFEVPTTPTWFPRRGNLVAALWELLFRHRARLRGDVCTYFSCVVLILVTAMGRCHRGCLCRGPAVTMRASSVSIRADSIFTMPTSLEARIGPKVIRPSFGLG